jgi:hypothetical protein
MFLFLSCQLPNTDSMGELISKVQWQQQQYGCVDGILLKIFEPSPFSKDWNSHKLGGAALSYELVTCIATGDIVAYNGPCFPAGKWNDIKIFRNKNKWQLKEAEWSLGDHGFSRGDRKILSKVDAQDRQHSYAMSCASRGRHETVNRRPLLQWEALNGAYRHDWWEHHLVF